MTEYRVVWKRERSEAQAYNCQGSTELAERVIENVKQDPALRNGHLRPLEYARIEQREVSDWKEVQHGD